MIDIDIDKSYSKTEAAECMGISIYAVNKAIRIGRLQSSENEGKIVIKGSDLYKYCKSRWDILRRKPLAEKKYNMSTIDWVLSECNRIANYIGVRIEFRRDGYRVIMNGKTYAKNLDLGCLLAFMQGCDMFYRVHKNCAIPKYYR